MYNGFGESMKLTVNKPWLMWSATKSLKVSEFFDFYKISQKKRRKLLHENGFLINGKPVTEETLINKNDCISVLAFDEEDQKITASEKPCDAYKAVAEGVFRRHRGDEFSGDCLPGGRCLLR